MRSLLMMVMAVTALVCLRAEAQDSSGTQPYRAPNPEASAAANSAMWAAMIPADCREAAMRQPSPPCEDTCKLRFPNTAAPVADACEKKNWVCDWPSQVAEETRACPPGWNGTYSQNHYYQLAECGTRQMETGKTVIFASGCTRSWAETRVEPCPADGHWTGTGITYGRIHSEALGTDLRAISETAVTGWVVQKVDCEREVTVERHEICPYLSGACSIERVGEKVISDSCGKAPGGAMNTFRRTDRQHLADNLATAVTDVAGTPLTLQSDCPAPAHE